MLIKAFTEKVAALVAQQHAHDPGGELLVWLRMALRRESSVGELYGVGNLQRRLARIDAPHEVVRLMGTTIANVWAQEKAHAAFLDAVLVAVAHPPTLRQRAVTLVDGLLGTMEGVVMSAKTSPSAVERVKAKLLLAIGRRVQEVPDFVHGMGAMSFREFCLLNCELEVTAVHGYERMLALLDRVAETGIDTTTLGVDIDKLVRDERYHNDVFTAVGEWFDVPSGNGLRDDVTLGGCVKRLAELRERAYG